MSTDDYRVDLPGGSGAIHLQNQDECNRWLSLEAAYRDQYDLRKINDLTNLGTLLVQHINLYRAQQALSGYVPELDDDDLPTGRMEQQVLKPADIGRYQDQVTSASKEIREIEKAMGVDKRSREQAGEENNREWLLRMKARAHRYGLHVSKRLVAYEQVMMEARWRWRLNEVGDAEDKQYEDVTDEGLIRWMREQLVELERIDREYAKTEGALVLGKI